MVAWVGGVGWGRASTATNSEECRCGEPGGLAQSKGYSGWPAVERSTRRARGRASQPWERLTKANFRHECGHPRSGLRTARCASSAPTTGRPGPPARQTGPPPRRSRHRCHRARRAAGQPPPPPRRCTREAATKEEPVRNGAPWAGTQSAASADVSGPTGEPETPAARLAGRPCRGSICDCPESFHKTRGGRAAGTGHWARRQQRPHRSSSSVGDSRPSTMSAVSMQWVT